MSKLKPCPFCKGKFEILDDADQVPGQYSYAAECQKCGIRIPPVDKAIIGKRAVAVRKVIALCNRRTAPPAPLAARHAQITGMFLKAWDDAEENPKACADGYNKKAFGHVQFWLNRAILAASAPPAERAMSTSPEQILDSLRWKADMKVTNHFGEVVWLKECFDEAGNRVGITDCCLAGEPCPWHAALAQEGT